MTLRPDPTREPVEHLCDPTEVALKSFFLGPQGENAGWLLERMTELLNKWFRWRRNFFPEDGSAISSSDQEHGEFRARQDQCRSLVDELIGRFEKELPKFSPRYVGHMFSEISLPALIGHILTLLHNPNIVARESAHVAADIENEALDDLGRLLGFPTSFGHFTSGGTVANFEMVVRASARCHAWVATVARLRQRGSCSLTMFEAAHLGWERYQELRAGVSDEELSPFLPESSDPWEAVRALEAVYSTRYRGPALIVPRSAHYSWNKATRLLGVGEANLRYVDPGSDGRYSVTALEEIILDCERRHQPILAVISVAGTTETGEVDPVDRIQDLLDGLAKRRGIFIWHHVDAAYGGFFCSMLRPSLPPPLGGGGPSAFLTPSVHAALAAIGRSDSVTLDPHKLGYVPFSSGTFLVADRRDYTCVRTLAPYVDYGHEDDRSRADHGPYTLEGSRSAAGAVATWLTSRAIGLNRSGYGLLLSRTIRQKQKLESWLADKLPSAHIYPGCDTNLLCFCLAKQGEAVGATNARTQEILTKLSGDYHYYVSKTAFALVGPGTGRVRDFAARWSAQVDQEHLMVLRLCLMNPFFDSTELAVSHIQRLVFSLCEFSH